MFSDVVYLFGKTFSSAPSFANKEELPDGTTVNKKELAEQAVLAAFAYLYNKKLIDFVLEEGKVLFKKTKRVKVKKLQSSAPDTSGLEAVIFTYSQDNSVWGITIGGLLQHDVVDPWAAVLQIVKNNLLDRGILKQVETGKVLFITKHKYVVNEDISKEEKQVTELKKTLEELQSKGELYKAILSDIKIGISSRMSRPSGGD